jgi:hypothetical protein
MVKKGEDADDDEKAMRIIMMRRLFDEDDGNSILNWATKMNNFSSFSRGQFFRRKLTAANIYT